MTDYKGLEVYWDGHASLRVVDRGFTVAVDPFSRVSPDFQADIVLVTKPEEGHLDVEKLEEICHGKTCVVLPEDVEREIPCLDVEHISEGEVLDIYGVEVEAVPSNASGLNFRFVMDDSSFYVTGDSEPTDTAFELEDRVELAFLPLDSSHLDMEEAVEYAVRLKPDKVVPYLYGPPLLEEVNTKPLVAELEDRSINCEVLGEESKD